MVRAVTALFDLLRDLCTGSVGVVYTGKIIIIDCTCLSYDITLEVENGRQFEF